MTAALLRQEFSVVLASGLEVERTDIDFANGSPERVRIEITVSNRGELPSPRTPVLLQAAPLGAFVRWRDLARLEVPPLMPGDSHVLELQATPTPATALGDADRVPPQRVLTALADDDNDNANQPRRTGQANLPMDLLRMVGRGGVHWAGNLNIFFEGKAVERHMARALRIYPGQTNLAMFVVGSGRDAYSFSLHGSGADWDAELYELNGASLLGKGEKPLLLNDWVELGRMGMMMLALLPPSDCDSGEVEVHVLQRSSGEKAIVEFSLDANASGPGCFVV